MASKKKSAAARRSKPVQINPREIDIDEDELEYMDELHGDYRAKLINFVQECISQGKLAELPAKPKSLYYCPVGGILTAILPNGDEYGVFGADLDADLNFAGKKKPFPEVSKLRHMFWQYVPRS